MDRLQQLGLDCTSHPARSSSSRGATQPAVSRAHSFRRWTKCPAGSHEPFLLSLRGFHRRACSPALTTWGGGTSAASLPLCPVLSNYLCVPPHPTTSSARPSGNQGTHGAQAQRSHPGPGSPRLQPSPAGHAGSTLQLFLAGPAPPPASGTHGSRGAHDI